jgi:hypothetical protein
VGEIDELCACAVSNVRRDQFAETQFDASPEAR